MNPKITPEIQSALEENPVGPIRLEGSPDIAPVFLIRLDDIPELQELLDRRINEKLAEAEADFEAGRFEEWNADQINRDGRARLNGSLNRDE